MSEIKVGLPFYQFYKGKYINYIFNSEDKKKELIARQEERQKAYDIYKRLGNPKDYLFFSVSNPKVLNTARELSASNPPKLGQLKGGKTYRRKRIIKKT
jgi:hypothetical protein